MSTRTSAAFRDSMFDPMVVDLFAGGGGASMGIERALGRPVDVAINHDPEAIAMHAINHPWTTHYTADIWSVDPRVITEGRPVGFMWASPDCKHFSKAKGGKPVSKKIRSLAWVVVKWAKLVRPSVIMLENVEEFTTWGPLGDDMRPCPKYKGRYFRTWNGELKKLGYVVEHRELRACDYGAPTTRKRLFLIARCDGLPIVWPEPTHFKNPAKKQQPWRTAAECIDWSIPCPSIFGRKKPLVEKTLQRIARGIQWYVIDSAKPFILNLTHGVRTEPLDEPMRTVTGTHRGEKAVIVSQVAPAIMTTKDHHAVTTATLVDVGGRAGQSRPRPLDEPTGTTTSKADIAIAAAHMVELRGTCRDGQALDQPAPAPTTTAGGTHAGLVYAFMQKYYGEGSQWSACDEPMHTIPTKDRMGLVTVTIDGEACVIIDIGMRMLTPRELYRAQGFPDDYVIEFEHNGRPLSKSSQVRMCGNSVSPVMSEALVRANLRGTEKRRRRSA